MTTSTTINLNTEIADEALTKSYVAYQNLTTARKCIRDQVNALFDAKNWQGVSAGDFLETYNEIDNGLYTQLEEFYKFQEILAKEIEEWKRMDGLIP